MKNLISYLYHLITWLFIFSWGKFLDFLTAGKRFVRTWNEIITIPLALVVWYFSPYLLRWMDPTAATFDSGVLQTFLLAAIGLFFINGVVWLLIKITFPSIYQWFDSIFEEEFTRGQQFGPVLTERERAFNLTTNQKCVLALSLFGLYLLAAVLLVKAL